MTLKRAISLSIYVISIITWCTAKIKVVSAFQFLYHINWPWLICKISNILRCSAKKIVIETQCCKNVLKSSFSFFANRENAHTNFLLYYLQKKQLSVSLLTVSHRCNKIHYIPKLFVHICIQWTERKKEKKRCRNSYYTQSTKQMSNRSVCVDCFDYSMRCFFDSKSGDFACPIHKFDSSFAGWLVSPQQLNTMDSAWVSQTKPKQNK